MNNLAKIEFNMVSNFIKPGMSNGVRFALTRDGKTVTSGRGLKSSRGADVRKVTKLI
jgi:hypothetical protein